MDTVPESEPTPPLRRTSGAGTDGWCSAQLRSKITTPPPHILSAQSPYIVVETRNCRYTVSSAPVLTSYPVQEEMFAPRSDPQRWLTFI